MNGSEMGKATSVLLEVYQERKRQHAQAGEQGLPDDTGEAGAVEQAALYRREADEALARRRATWRQVLRAVVFEAFGEPDRAQLRAALIRVAATACAWIEDLDRRSP